MPREKKQKALSFKRLRMARGERYCSRNKRQNWLTGLEFFRKWQQGEKLT